MAKTSKGVILSQASQIKSDYSFALIKATADNKSLVQDTSSAELKVNALVEYSKDSQWDPKKLTNLGFPAGCFLIVDLRGQDIHAADLITNLALVRQYGYQAGVIDDLSTLDDIKALKANQIYLINSGKTNDDQDASLNGNEITDGSGKLSVGMSVKWQRDYTNVDVSGDHAGFVGMGQDTLLKGGNAFGYSTNGRDFNAVITPKGLIFRRPDAERMWRLLKPNEIADINSTVGDKVKKEIDSATAEIPAAVSAANSAVSAAESAIAASKVNSDAIVAQSEAISEAKSAMDSATAEIQQTAANAASDAAKIRADVARVQNEVDTAKTANSASVDKLKSDIGLAQKDLDNVHDSLAKAQSAVEQNQKLINDSVAKINSDIAQSRQDIVTAQQANNDLAKQLDTYSKEAQEQGKTIKTIQDNQDGFSITIADVKGDVTKVSDTVDGLSAGLKDAQGNIASVKAQADQLNATLTDHSKDIAQLTATAKELSSTLEDADGRLSKVEQTASEQSTTLSDLQGNLTQVKQTADNLVTTLKDAQGNIDQIKQDAKGTLEQLSNVQGDITALQTDVSGIKLTIADHEKNIHTLQVDSKTLKDDMADAKGNISSLQKTSTSLVSEFKDHDGRLSKIEQTATEHTSELADAKGNIDKVTQKADSLEATLTDAQKDINSIKVDASGIHEALTGQGKQITTINATLDGLNTKYEGVSDDLSKLSGTVATNSTQIDQNKKSIALKADQATVDNLSGEVSRNTAQLKVQADQISSKVSSEDFSALDNKVDSAIAQIQKNSTAIDQTNQKISLKADQTEVDKIKNTATQNSSRLDVMAGEIQSKVTSTDVDNIINGKGYATTSTVQSLITQKAGTINESITNLEGKFNSSSSVNLAEKTNQGTTNWTVDPGNGASTISEVNINGIRGVRFTQTRKSTSWWVIAYQLNLDYFEPNQDYIISFDVRTSSDNFAQGGMLNIARGDSSHAYLANTSFRTNFKKNQLTHVSCTGHSYSSLDKNGETFYLNCIGLGQCDWVDIVNLKIARGTIDKGYSPAPSDNATVTQLQSVTASIDGLQSTVANKADKSQITQLSNLMQSKVGTADFEQLKRSVDMQTLDSADINNMKTNGHYFVHNLANNPIGGWVYVDVTGDGKYRIRQDVYQDSWNKHKFRNWYGDHWTNWEEGATYSEITQLQDAINLRVQKGELLSQINLTAGNTLIQSNKLYLDASSVVFSGRAFIPSAAIASLSADKITTGLLNTNNINLGDGRTRLMADHDNFYIQPAGSASSNSGIRMGYDSLSFMTNDIPNGYGASVPYYSINYDGSSNGSLNIQTFDHINPGGATSTQNWYSMSGLISLSKKQIDFATNNNIHMHIDEGGVTVRPTLCFGNSTWNGTWAGFTRLDNSNTVEFNTGDNNGENFHVNSGARFMKYVYFNDYCRAQGWLTYSTLSKKTNIKKLDTSLALDKIRQDDQYLYEYKRNVAKGVYDPQASFIIDDVNDVSHYSVPREFIDQTGKYREPSVELSYLIAAFQEIDKQVQKQKEEIKELKEKLQHE